MLQPSDPDGPATVDDHFYSVDLPALSEYQLDMQPAGAFSEFAQLIDWYPNANEATFHASVAYPLITSDLSALLEVSGVTSHPRPWTSAASAT